MLIEHVIKTVLLNLLTIVLSMKLVTNYSVCSSVRIIAKTCRLYDSELGPEL